MNGNPDVRLLRLFQLASPMLPVGAYSYSQGLEAAIDAGAVSDAASVRRWITDVLECAMGRLEAPVLLRLTAAWRAQDFSAVTHWNEIFLAARETAEMRAETVQMGFSLARLLAELGGIDESALMHLRQLEEPGFPTAFALALAQWEIPRQDGLTAYIWAWLENQILAAVKTVPLGQTEGQRMLLEMSAQIAQAVEMAGRLGDDELGSFMPRLAILSSRHETQHTRLFRS